MCFFLRVIVSLKLAKTIIPNTARKESWKLKLNRMRGLNIRKKNAVTAKELRLS